MKRLLSPASLVAMGGVVALISLLAYGIASRDGDRGIEEALARGERPAAPQVTLPRLTGPGSESLSEYRGRVVVLNYWASWCDPCRAESPLLQRWHERMAPRGGTVVGIDVLDVASDARAFARRYGLSYPMLRDADGRTQRDFGVVAFPETFVLDRAGRIAATKRGPVDDRFLERTVVPLLEENA